MEKKSGKPVKWFVQSDIHIDSIVNSALSVTCNIDYFRIQSKFLNFIHFLSCYLFHDFMRRVVFLKFHFLL